MRTYFGAHRGWRGLWSAVEKRPANGLNRPAHATVRLGLIEAGRKLPRHAEAIVGRLQAAEEAMRPFQKSLAGHLSLGVTPTSGRMLVPEIFSRCAEESRPRVAVHQAMRSHTTRRTRPAFHTSGPVKSSAVAASATTRVRRP